MYLSLLLILFATTNIFAMRLEDDQNRYFMQKKLNYVVGPDNRVASSSSEQVIEVKEVDEKVIDDEQEADCPRKNNRAAQIKDICKSCAVISCIVSIVGATIFAVTECLIIVSKN